MPLQIPVTQTGLEASIQQAMRNAGRNAQLNLGTNSRQINALAQPLGRITGQADEFTKSMEAANARVFAFGASVGIINGVTKAFSSLVKNTIEVEKSLVEINTVLNASGDSLQKFGNKLFDVAKTTGQTFDVVAKGALELARQGLSTEETLKRINDALILSRLSGLDAQQSVEGLTAAFNSFKETGITTSEILNKLVVVSQKYSVSERDLIEGLKRSASVADQAGVSFDELVGIITTVQERTARGGAVIGNAFKTIFARIQDTGALQDLANLGVQVTDLEGKVLPATRILQNLAGEFNNLSQLEQADIAKKLGGVYQLSNLLAAVKDLSSEQSKYNDIVKLSAGATNEAYQKNAALNETLASLINKVSVSAQQLGATLGKIGITDSLKSLLGFFNNILEGIQNILGEESALGTFVRGLAKGIGNVLAGPGLALFGAIIAKLSKDLISFGLESLKSFFKIGQAAKDIASVEKSIAAALGSNLTLQKQLFALEGNRAAQIKLMTDAIVQQEAVMRRMASTAGSLAGPLYQQGVRSSGGQGLRVPRSAGGYMPAVSQESRDISRGVGGAKAGDKPVVIPNFAFGGGKKGTMVAHTGEYIVPNFAAGGSAIFNRDMVRSMGLPAGAQKISAAGGFIPNFAVTENEINAKIAQWRASGNTGSNALKRVLSAEKPDPINKAAAERLLAEKEAQASSVINAESIIGPLPVVLAPLGKASIGGMKLRRNYGKDKIDFAFSGYTTSQSGIDKLQTQFERRFSDDAIKTFAKERALLAAQQVAAAVGSQPVAPKTIEDIRDTDVKGFLSSVRGAMGGIFDAAVSSALRIKAEKGVEGGDFDIRGLNAEQVQKIETLFGKKVLPPSGLADFKIGFGENTTKSMVDKTIKEYGPKINNYIETRDSQVKAINKADIKTASKKAVAGSNGYIPNFAKYIYDSDRIPADKGATLKAILASSAKKNLIIGPAGSGKSTLASKLGKFLTGASDVANASEIDILSGAARAKGGGLSKNLEALIAAVNASGGKVSYLYAKNLDILSRRIGRTSASDGDLRSKKQLIGTRYAPLNQFDFMGAVKSRSRNFNMVSGAAGFIPNFADPLKEAINREISAGVPASQIYIDKNSSLKNSMNPMGLMVANRRDEPAGGMQGINRARREGANPMMYGAASGFVPNYANTGPGTMINSVNTSTGVSRTPTETTTSSADLEKPKRDFLGTIFAVQAGLSLLTGATEGATSELAKYTNIVSGGIGTATSTLFAFQGLSAALPKFAGFLGPAGIAVSAVTAAFQIGKGIMLEYWGANKGAAQNTALLAKSAESAAMRLDELNPVTQAKVKESVSNIRYNLEQGLFTKEGQYIKPINLLGENSAVQKRIQQRDEFINKGGGRAVKVEFGTVSEEDVKNYEDALTRARSSGLGTQTIAKTVLEEAAKNDGELYTANIQEIIKKLGELSKNPELKRIKQDIDDIFNFEDLSFAPIDDALKQYAAKIKDGTLEIEEQKKLKIELAKIIGDTEVTEGLITDAIERGKKAAEQRGTVAQQINAESSKQLEQTIRNIQIESSLRKKLSQQTIKANNAQIAADLDIANIKSDITLSELERNKLIGRRQFQLEKDLAVLENQKSEMTEIANLAKEISESSFISPSNRTAATEQAQNAIKALSGQDINATTDVAKMLGEMKIDFNLINTETTLKNVLNAALKIQDAAAKTKEEFNQQNNFKEKGLSLAEAEAKVNENNSRVFEKMQNTISAIADDRSILARRLGYQSQLIDAQKDVKLARLETSDSAISSSQRIEQQRAIEREAFNKQLEINTRKSIVEAEADFIRNSKVQENIIALQDNNTALKENTDALLKIVPTTGEPQSLNRVSFITGGVSQTGAQIAPVVPKGSNIPIVNIPYDGRNAANRYNNPGGAYPRKDLLQFGLEGQGIIGGGHPIGKYPSIAHGAAANMAHFSYLNPVGKTVGQARNQWVTGKSSGFMPLGGMDSNRVISPNDLNNPSFMKQWMRATAQAEGFKGGLSEADLDAAYNFYQSNKAPNVNLGGGFTATPSNVKMTSPEDQIKKARELSSLTTSTEILAKAREYTKELGLQDNAAESVANQIKDLALRIQEVGEEKALQENLQEAKITAEDLRDTINSIAKSEKLSLKTQLKDLEESPITFKEGMENGFLAMQVKQAQFGYNLGKEIPEMFSQGMSDAITSAITGAESLEDALLNAANSFLTEINKRLMSNLVDQATSSLGNLGISLFQNKASGGMITGGSGTKDDVPAMLMGGEYVIKKKAVQKYGPEFLSAINNGTLGGYAKGGKVKKTYEAQTGEGGYFLPGLYDNKSIIGTGDLISFATQNYTSGARDVISSGSNFASINLEQESMRLTQRGRESSPLFAATQSAKEQALGIAFEQMSIEEQYVKAIEEAKRQEKERQKALRKQLLISSAMAIGSAVAGPLLGAAGAGFKAAAGASKAAGGGFFANMGAGLKGIFTGGQIGGLTQNVGGINNLLKSVGQGLSGNFAEAGNLFKLSQIGNMDQFNAAYMKSVFANGSKGSSFMDYAQNIGYIPKAMDPSLSAGIGINGGNSFNWFEKVFAPAGSALNNINNSRQRRATGGTIPETSGIDTIPTLLSGGEFIMNRAASQNIGAGNLQALNSGASSLPTEEKTEELNDKLLSKLDELIEANSSKSSVGEININVESSGKSSESISNGQAGSANQQLARNIRDMVVKVIQDEQRLGGLLR